MTDYDDNKSGNVEMKEGEENLNFKMWSNNWYRAKSFFESTSETDWKSRSKDIWYNEFFEDLEAVRKDERQKTNDWWINKIELMIQYVPEESIIFQLNDLIKEVKKKNG